MSLEQWIGENNTFNYGQLDRQWLQHYLQDIGDTNLGSSSYEEKFVFYLNAYNIITIYAALEKLRQNSAWKGNTSFLSRFNFFYLKKYLIARKKMSLYVLENKILRKEFQDPRVHFAINCASKSCPPLSKKLFTTENLYSLLEELTFTYINNNKDVIYNTEQNILYLNKIFAWYRKDFAQYPNIKSFIKHYWRKNVDIPENARVHYLKYDWNLNS